MSECVEIFSEQFKIALKKFLHTYSFYTAEEYLSLSWIKNCITRFFCSGILILGTLYKSFIDYIFWTDHISLYKLDLLLMYLLQADHISLYKLDLAYLCIIITNYYYYYYMYHIVVTHSVLCLLLYIDKFYIHFGGSLEY